MYIHIKNRVHIEFAIANQSREFTKKKNRNTILYE